VLQNNAADGRADESERALMRRVGLRIVPLAVLLYLVAYIDRQNVGYAKLQMLGSLGLSETTYGLGASLFFIGYLFFEVPSNFALYTFGARRWLARIMLTWGVITLLLALTSSAAMFYILRFLLGAAEAGLYPGIIYYLSAWFPNRYRLRVLGLFTLGSSVGNMVGSLIGGIFLDLDGLGGLQGWQWVFIATGLPAILLTFVTLRYLPETPATARFLNTEEKARLATLMAVETSPAPRHAGSPFAVLRDVRLLGFALGYMLISMSTYGVGYWLPTVVRGFGVSGTINGLLNMIPWFCASVVLAWLPGRLHGQRRVAQAAMLACAIGVICFIVGTLAASNVLRLVALSIGAPCIYILIPCFWTVPSRFLQGSAAAIGIAAINSLGNVGGFLAQNVMPWVGRFSGSALAPLLVPACCLLLFGGATFVVSRLAAFRAIDAADRTETV
jgi:MFS family permease